MILVLRDNTDISGLQDTGTFRLSKYFVSRTWRPPPWGVGRGLLVGGRKGFSRAVPSNTDKRISVNNRNLRPALSLVSGAASLTR